MHTHAAHAAAFRAAPLWICSLRYGLTHPFTLSVTLHGHWGMHLQLRIGGNPAVWNVSDSRFPLRMSTPRSLNSSLCSFDNSGER